MRDDNYEHYDLYEDERPYRWIGIVVWSIILFYLFSLIAFGVFTTPVENGRPVLADTEMRQTRRYIDFIWRSIDQTQRIYADAHRIFSFYLNSGVTDSSTAAEQIMSLRIEAMSLAEQLDRVTVPPRFSGRITTRGNTEYVLPKAFHPMFQELIAVLIDMLTEMYAYLTDFDEIHLARIDELDDVINNIAEDTFALFSSLVAN